MHRTVAGLAPAAPGYRTVAVAPRPGGGLSWASAVHDSPYGRHEVRWERHGDRLDVSVTVPPSTSAVVALPEPGWGERNVTAGSHQFSCTFRPVQDDPPIPGVESVRGDARWLRTPTPPSAVWRPIEIDLVGAQTHAGPYTDVDLWCDFEDENGTVLRRPAFWAGSSTWKIRFAAPTAGRWRWRTSGNVHDPGLVGRTGELQAAEPASRGLRDLRPARLLADVARRAQSRACRRHSVDPDRRHAVGNAMASDRRAGAGVCR